MTLTDEDILELNDLCNALVDGTITERQQAKLSQWLATSAEARELYVRTMGLSASLYHFAGEMQTGEPDHADAPTPVMARTRTRSWWMVGALAAAACVGIIAWANWPKPPAVAPTGPIAKVAPPTTTASTPVAVDPNNEFVAQLTGSRELNWSDGDASLDLGGRLRKGQQVELANGFAEITFDSGARVVLHG